MNGRDTQWRMLVVALVVATAAMGCRKEAKPEKPPTLGKQMDEAKDRWAIDSARIEANRIEAMAPSDLPGSSWTLVQLRLGDSTIKPEPAAPYTLEFGTDGRVSVVGGCNRGSGTYTVTPPSGLAIGPLATTRAMCPPGSMSARFLGDFEKMRSYAIVGGRLHVSLSDGGVYEFEPPAPAAAASTTVIRAVFACTDSAGARRKIHATFKGGEHATVTLTSGKEKVVLPQAVSGSGARYEGSGVMLWNKGRDAMVTWKGVSLKCIGVEE